MVTQRLLLVHSPTCGWADLRAVLDGLDGAVIVGEVAREDEALRLAATTAPTALLCSDRIEERPALPTLRLLRAACPAARLIVLAGRIDRAILADFVPLRLRGYFLIGQMSPEQLRDQLAISLRSPVVAGSDEVIPLPSQFACTCGGSGKGAGEFSSGACSMGDVLHGRLDGFSGRIERLPFAQSNR